MDTALSTLLVLPSNEGELETYLHSLEKEIYTPSEAIATIRQLYYINRVLQRLSVSDTFLRKVEQALKENPKDELIPNLLFEVKGRQIKKIIFKDE